jgi:hypothetical protein
VSDPIRDKIIAAIRSYIPDGSVYDAERGEMLAWVNSAWHTRERPAFTTAAPSALGGATERAIMLVGQLHRLTDAELARLALGVNDERAVRERDRATRQGAMPRNFGRPPDNIGETVRRVEARANEFLSASRGHSTAIGAEAQAIVKAIVELIASAGDR